MSQDVGKVSEVKGVINSMEAREAGAESPAPAAKLKDNYAGGKTQPTFGSFKKPSIGSVRKHME